MFSIAYILVDLLSVHLSCLSNLSLEVKNDDVINDTQAVIGCLRFIGLMANLKYILACKLRFMPGESILSNQLLLDLQTSSLRTKEHGNNISTSL